jgi:NAD-dependent epimerase/dehydratase family protein
MIELTEELSICIQSTQSTTQATRLRCQMQTQDYFRVALSSLIRMIRHLSANHAHRPAQCETRERTNRIDIITCILVTGTEGYLGSLLAPELARQGYEVIVASGIGKPITLRCSGLPVRNATDLESSRYCSGSDQLEETTRVRTSAGSPGDRKSVRP